MVCSHGPLIVMSISPEGKRGDADVFFVELEQPQKIDKVALDEAQGLAKSQLGVLKMQAAQRADFITDFAHIGRQLARG